MFPMIKRIIPVLILTALLSNWSFGQNAAPVDTLVVGSVIDEKSRRGVEAIISIIGTDESSIEVPTDESGSFIITDRDVSLSVAYVATAESPDNQFLSRTKKLYFKGLEKGDLPIKMIFEIRLQGCVLPIPPISFFWNSAKIKPEGKVGMDGLIEAMLDNPGVVIEIIGRADCSEDNPKLLSEERAASAIAYLMENGIEKERLVPVGRSCNDPYQIEGGNEFFSKGQMLTQEYISTLTDSAAVDLARSLNSMSTYKIIRTDYVPKN